MCTAMRQIEPVVCAQPAVQGLFGSILVSSRVAFAERPSSTRGVKVKPPPKKVEAMSVILAPQEHLTIPQALLLLCV